MATQDTHWCCWSRMNRRSARSCPTTWRPKAFAVVTADNGEEALLLVDEELPDLIVLDWMMPQVSGIEVCRQSEDAAETRGIPIIMLSARSEEVDRVRGLETGADDYVIKPYSVIELMARVRAHLRRSAALDRRGGAGIWRYPAGQRNPPGLPRRQGAETGADRVSPAGHLHGKTRPGAGAARQLLDRVWGRDIYVDTRTVDVHIGRLRKALMPAWRRRSAAHGARRGLCAGWRTRSPWTLFALNDWPLLKAGPMRSVSRAKNPSASMPPMNSALAGPVRHPPPIGHRHAQRQFRLRFRSPH